MSLRVSFSRFGSWPWPLLLVWAVLLTRPLVINAATHYPVNVTAHPLFTDTGLTLQSTDKVSIWYVSGTWGWDWCTYTGPEGTETWHTGMFIDNERQGSLIGFVAPDPCSAQHNTPAWFDVSTGRATVTGKSGRQTRRIPRIAGD